MTYNDEEFHDEIRAVEIRYVKALDAGDSKKRGLDSSYLAITDSVSDIPWLLGVICDLREELEEYIWMREGLEK